jgi:hypothetical protein
LTGLDTGFSGIVKVDPSVIYQDINLGREGGSEVGDGGGGGDVEGYPI